MCHELSSEARQCKTCSRVHLSCKIVDSNQGDAPPIRVPEAMRGVRISAAANNVSGHLAKERENFAR